MSSPLRQSAESFCLNAHLSTYLVWSNTSQSWVQNLQAWLPLCDCSTQKKKGSESAVDLNLQNKEGVDRIEIVLKVEERGMIFSNYFSFAIVAIKEYNSTFTY